LKTRPGIAESPKTTDSSPIKGEVRFENVSFAYGVSQPPAICDVTMTATPGSITGIVGPQGSGKTTLLQLIPRIYDVSKGRITIDGIDVRDIPLSHLRNHISFVSQEPFLFSGSIRDNITFGNSIDPHILQKATKEAALDDTIRSFPEGYDTIVGEKGVVLSGGQKQRVVLARALLHDAPILLLDDPIGQVDTQTANAIITAIRSIAKEKTVIIVSHRLSAVQFANQILVMDQGKITESGTHDELIGLNQYYARTYQLQRIEDEK
jgi:ATP-binding cassette, subfamily B, multidrug efflux pump